MAGCCSSRNYFQPSTKAAAELIASGELQSRLAEPQPEIVVRVIRGFAWVALSVGFSIVVWIIYAMIFAYR